MKKMFPMVQILHQQVLPKIVEKIFIASMRKENGALPAYCHNDVVIFVKDNHKELSDNYELLMYMTFLTIELFEVKNLSSNDIDELYIKMQEANIFLQRVLKKLILLQKIAA